MQFKSINWSLFISPNIHKGRWSKTEDQALTEAVQFYLKITPDSYTLPWNKISESIPSRTGIQCQARWTEALDPAIRKGRWIPEEDEQLKAAVAVYGCCWIRVASMIPTRTQRQCRTRWNQIHSHQIKTKSLSNNTAKPNALALNHYDNSINYAMTPLNFFDNAINFIQLDTHSTNTSNNDMLPSPTGINNTAPPITVDDIMFNQYMDGLNSSSSSTSSRSSSFTSTSSVNFPRMPFTDDQNYQQILNPQKFQPYQDFLSGLQSSELDLLLGCLSTSQ